MANVRFSETPKETFNALGPGDQQEVNWVVSLLEDDDTRQAGAFDLALVEQGLRVWAFVVPPVFIAFVESGPDELTVVHLSMLSHFGYARGY